MGKIIRTLFTAAFALAVVACSGSSSRMLPIHMEEKYVDKPIKNALIIVIVDNQEIRAIFEKHFKDWLNAKGVDAVVSADVFPVEMGVKLEKEAIVEVAEKYDNDTILITHLVGLEDSEVFSRDRPQFFFNYYGFFNYGLAYVTWPTVYGEKVEISLETGLYDVKTESLIWAGDTQLKNPKTTGKAIGHVVELVIKELEKNGLLPKTPKDKKTS
jgi:hypothetical protein